MSLSRRIELLALAPLLVAACQRPHACDAACEAGLVAAGAAPAANEPHAHQDPATPELEASEALAAFDEAWQTIHDSHFDKGFNGVDWEALRTELRPRAERATSRDEVRAVITDMLARLGQSHFAVIPSDALPESASGGDSAGGLGFDVRLRAGSLLVSALEPAGAALAAGVGLGWSVERIGAFEVADVLARMAAAEGLGERKLAFMLWAAATAEIHGRLGGRTTVVFRDATDQAVELELERRARDVTAHAIGTLPTFHLAFQAETLARGEQEIGRIAFSNWFLPVMQPFDAALDGMRGCDGVVIDLRGNTGGAAAMTMGIAGHFFAESKKLGTMMTRDSTVNIMAFPRRTNAAGELVEPFAGPLAILVDETTASASEVFAGGMQSLGRARIFGATTAGAVLPAVTTRLPNGDTLLHALGDFETSTGVRLEGAGVVPDAPVLLTRAELLAGRDPVLEAALAWITSADH